MNPAQRPLGHTGFTAASTAREVLAGIDLTGKNVIVTAGHNGLGLETTRVLSQAGARVTVAARDPERAASAVSGLQAAGVEVSQLDLIDPRSVDAFARRWLASGRPLHILVNNAGPGSSAQLERDARGYEPHFATCHLGHFQLTLALLPALQAAHGARVVNVSSGAQRTGQIRWDDPNFAGGYNSRTAYAQAKRAMVLFAVELDRRWAQYGIRGFAVHPGVVLEHKLTAATREAVRGLGLLDELGQPIIDPAAGLKTLQQGASSIVFAACSPLLDGIGGVYIKDNDVSPVVDETQKLSAHHVQSEVVSASIDPQAATRLWELSEKLLR